MKFDYLIIGNSAGAVGCIEGIRSVDRTGKIAVVSDEEHHTYSRALIPYYLDGQVNRDSIYYRPLDFYEKSGVTPYLGMLALKIDFDRKEVELDRGGRLRYGKLLLATGGKPFVPPVRGLDREDVCTFLSLGDALRIERALGEGAESAVVLGGGVIGLMAAEVLKKRGLEVRVLELADRVLAPVVDETASDIVESLFKENGVQILTKKTIEEVKGDYNVKSVVATGGIPIPCDLLVVAVGVVPRVELVINTGMRINKGIVVNQQMLTSIPDVYACGDCAEAYDFVTDTSRLIPLWPNAYSGGRTAGLNMAGVKRQYVQGTSMNAMHFFNLYMVNAGINVTSENKTGEFEIIGRLDKETNSYRKFALSEGKIKGMVLVGDVDRAGVLINLMRSGINVDGFKQELLNKNFGYSSIPDRHRWQLLSNEVILGVVKNVC